MNTAHVSKSSTENDNIQNQLNSTNTSLARVTAEKQAVEQTSANQASQLSALQKQLSSAKTPYETESRHLNTLRERLASQTGDIQRTKQELFTAESNLSTIGLEKTELRMAFLT